MSEGDEISKPTKRNDGENNNDSNNSSKKNSEDNNKSNKNSETQSLNVTEDTPQESGGKSCFKDEAKLAYFWVGFITVYWSILAWVKVALTGKFIIPALFGWIIGFTVIIGVTLSIKAGQYPSGATAANPNDNSIKGRLAAFVLSCIISIDLIILVFVGIANGAGISDLFRALGHFTALIWGTLFFFNRFYRNNKDIAIKAFWSEWLDIFLSIIVLWYLNVKQDNDSGCFDHRMCSIYGIILIFQLIGWVWPMMLIESWGVKKDAPGVAMHLAVLDICTNLPLVIAILSIPRVSYRKHLILWFDIIYKSFGLIQSVSYNSVYYIWLRKGDLFKKKEEQKTETQS